MDKASQEELKSVEIKLWGFVHFNTPHVDVALRVNLNITPRIPKGTTQATNLLICHLRMFPIKTVIKIKLQ